MQGHYSDAKLAFAFFFLLTGCENKREIENLSPSLVLHATEYLFYSI